MKKLSILLSSALIAGVLLTGCGEPLTPEKFNAGFSDKGLATSFFKFYAKDNWNNSYSQNALFLTERLCNFSPIESTLGNSYNFAQEKASTSEIYTTYKEAAFKRGNTIKTFTGVFNAKVMGIKLGNPNLPKQYQDKLYYWDSTPLIAEFDSKDNLVSLMISYTETYVMFNHFNNPSAPVETTLKTELYVGTKLLPFKNAISKKDWEQYLLNTETPPATTTPTAPTK